MSRYKGIARYVHMMRPSSPKGSDKLRWSICLLFHKSDPQCAQINSEVETAKVAGFPRGFPPTADTCWIDLAITEPGNPAVADYMCLKTSTSVDYERPFFVDSSLTAFIDPAADSNATGKYVYADVFIDSYETGKGGVKTYPNGIMVTNEVGPIPVESLSSKPDAETMFGDVAGGTPAAPNAPAAPAPAAPAPAAPAAPQYVMTAKAGGFTREQLLANGQGWTDTLLIEQGMMTLANGVTPSFAR